MSRPQRRDDQQQGYPPSIYRVGGGQQGGSGFGYSMGQMNPQNGSDMGGGQQGQHQMQMRQQQQQMQQQGQPQQQGGPGSDGQSNTAPPEMNLANVLHYLQSEWRRWERDRNEWEIERADMRARIALLEGQRRSAENLKVDLLRRVKMLEFALRQERIKAGGRANAVAPSRLAALQDEDRGSRDDREGSGSSEGGDDIERPPRANGTHPAGPAKAASTAHRPVPDTTAWKNLSGPPRDPKARARSREYLKQCLQEITYLTSPGALNPLPTRAPVTTDEASGDSNAPDRPLRSLPEQPVPPFQPPASTNQEPAEHKEEHVEESAAVPEEKSEEIVPNGAPAETAPQSETAPSVDAPPSPAPRTVTLPEADGLSTSPEQRQVVTAIYRPESKAAWREELRAANEAAKQVPWPPRRTSDEEQLAGLTLVEEDVKAEETGEGDRVWTTRRTLKSHLDIVRGVSLAHGPDLVLATGGDDCTVKVWALDATGIMSNNFRPLASTELEPVATYRGHTLPVTAVTISSTSKTVFSASMDSTIRLWRLASKDDDPYAPYDASRTLQTLEGHTDIVWDICLMPTRTQSTANGGKPHASETRLVSASADGSVKVWEERDGRWSLQSSYSDFGGVPTCLSVDQHDFACVLVGLSTGLVKVISLEDGHEVNSFGDDGSQVNAILSHATLPLVVTGHEDGQLRFFDSKTGAASSPGLPAHPAPITSLALSPLSPMCILSSSVDCSVRLWDLQRKTSLQDLTGHRQRADEGVTHVASHPELPIVASAGADGAVRVWGAG